MIKPFSSCLTQFLAKKTNRFTTRPNGCKNRIISLILCVGEKPTY